MISAWMDTLSSSVCMGMLLATGFVSSSSEQGGGRNGSCETDTLRNIDYDRHVCTFRRRRATSLIELTQPAGSLLFAMSFHVLTSCHSSPQYSAALNPATSCAELVAEDSRARPCLYRRNNSHELDPPMHKDHRNMCGLCSIQLKMKLSAYCTAQATAQL